jgi:DNA-binding transcriptional LysR family regulator
MDLDLLPAFVAFADALNFTRAAKVLHLTQPAVHMQVRKLEESVGVPLYRRVGRRIELTPAGEELARFGRETAERSATFLDGLRGRAATLPAVLAAGEGAFLYLLGPALRAYLGGKNSPLRLLTRDRDGTVEAVRTGVAHLGVAVVDSVPEGIEREPLTSVEMVLVMPRRHPLAARRLIRLRDLEGVRLVAPGAGSPHRVMLEQALGRVEVPWSVSVEATGWELMTHFVELGLGLAVVNACCRLPSTLTARPVPELSSVQYTVLWRRGSVDHPGAHALLEAVRRCKSDWRAGTTSAWARLGEARRIR